LYSFFDGMVVLSPYSSTRLSMKLPKLKEKDTLWDEVKKQTLEMIPIRPSDFKSSVLLQRMEAILNKMRGNQQKELFLLIDNELSIRQQ
jgi:hypothetical protein